MMFPSMPSIAPVWNILPTANSLGSLGAEKTYLGTCICPDPNCNEPTSYFSASDEVCPVQTMLLRLPELGVLPTLGSQGNFGGNQTIVQQLAGKPGLYVVTYLSGDICYLQSLMLYAPNTFAEIMSDLISNETPRFLWLPILEKACTSFFSVLISEFPNLQ